MLPQEAKSRLGRRPAPAPLHRGESQHQSSFGAAALTHRAGRSRHEARRDGSNHGAEQLEAAIGSACAAQPISRRALAWLAAGRLAVASLPPRSLSSAPVAGRAPACHGAHGPAWAKRLCVGASPSP